MAILKKLILFKIFLFFVFSSFLSAKNIGYASNSSAEIIHDIQSLKPSQEYLIGVKFNLDPGWHTYWKNPGDSGGPIEVNWNQSKNLEIGPIKWPVPELIPYEPLMTYGYNNFVIYPFEYTQQNKNLSIIEKVKKFKLIKEEFTIENGMLTPTLKLKRKNILEKYKDDLEKLY